MQSLVTADEFIAECKSRHQSSFFQPENGTETATEKYTFNRCKCNQSFGEGSVLNPTECPFCFFLNCRNGFNGMKKPVFFPGIFNITVNQQRVGFSMNIFHHDLESIKATGFRK